MSLQNTDLASEVDNIGSARTGTRRNHIVIPKKPFIKESRSNIKFKERFEGRISLMNKEGDYGVAASTRLPIKKLDLSHNSTFISSMQNENQAVQSVDTSYKRDNKLARVHSGMSAFHDIFLEHAANNSPQNSRFSNQTPWTNQNN